MLMEMESIQEPQTEGNLMLTDHNTLLQQFLEMFSLIITWVFLRDFVLFWARISCYRSYGHHIHSLSTSDPKLLEFHLCTATIMLNLEFSYNMAKSGNTEVFALNLAPSPGAMKFYGSKHLLHILWQPQIIFHVKVINCDVKKNVSEQAYHSQIPCYLWWVGELVLRSWVWESRLWTSSRQHSRDDHVGGVSSEWHWECEHKSWSHPTVMWWHGLQEDALTPYPLKPVAGRREGPGVLRIGELILPLKDGNTWEVGSNNIPLQPTKADPAGSDVGEPPLRAWEQESWP